MPRPRGVNRQSCLEECCLLRLTFPPLGRLVQLMLTLVVGATPLLSAPLAARADEPKVSLEGQVAAVADARY